MIKYFNWIILFLSFTVTWSVYSCTSDQNENEQNNEPPIAIKELNVKDSIAEDSSIDEPELGDYGLEINGVEVKPTFGDELKVEIDTVIFAREGAPFGDYKLYPSKWSRNLKYTAYHGRLCNNRLETVFDKAVTSYGKCGNEMGATFRILEDGTGCVTVCSGVSVRIDKFIDRNFNLKKHTTWEIVEERTEDYYPTGSQIGLTQDGKYLYKISTATVLKESDQKVYRSLTKYDIIQEKLIWTKEIKDPNLHEIWCISPDNKLIFTKNRILVDENFDPVMKPYLHGTIREDRAIPQFFTYQGKQMLMVPTKNSVYFLDCADSSSRIKVLFRWIKYIQYCFVHEDQIILQIVLVNGEKKLVTIPLDDPSKILIRPNTKNLVRGLDNKLVLADDKKFEVFKILE